jgi:PHS family inorganic phosphate transporter-like MFS transporter
MIGAVFAMQGLGQFAAAMMTLVVTVAFKDTLVPVKTPATCGPACQRDVDIMWRIIIGFGAVPGWFALYYRLTIPETPRYTFDVRHDIEKATADTRAFHSGRRGEGYTDTVRRAKILKDVKHKYHTRRPTWRDFVRYISKSKNAITLFGTAGSWFFLDIAFYGLGLNNASILSIIGYSSKENLYRVLYNNAVGNLIIICAGAIPGYWFTVMTVDIIGRRTIQIAGFCILTMLFAIIGFQFHNLSSSSLLALYVLCQFFFNFGRTPSPFLGSSLSVLLTLPFTHLLLRAHPLIQFQAPTPQHSSLLPKSSPPASAQLATASPPRLGKSVP